VLLAENGKLTSKELAKTLNLTDSTIKRNIKTLKKKGLIERIGARKSGSWLVKN
jgi:predicted HTH transcriptional regulator